MIICLLIYLIAVIVTWIYAGWVTGAQFARTAKANPQMPLMINWVSVFFQGLVWLAFWASFLGEKAQKRRDVQAEKIAAEAKKRNQPTLEELNNKMLAKAGLKPKRSE